MSGRSPARSPATCSPGGRLELGEFLRAKRASITPEEVGLPAVGNPRRVPGLRREELAQLAGVSVDYYTRLEQGRTPSASEPVLSAIARALRMDGAEQAYLFQLARRTTPRRPEAEQRAVSAQTRLLLDNLAASPAFVIGRRMDVLAWNRLACALFVDFAELPAERRNFIRLVFLDPRMRALFADWDSMAPRFVELLRMSAAKDPFDTRLAALVGELSLRDDDLRRWWAGPGVRGVTAGRKVLRHPQVGELTLDWQALVVADAPDQVLIVQSAPPGSPTHDALRIPESLTAAPSQP